MLKRILLLGFCMFFYHSLVNDLNIVCKDIPPNIDYSLATEAVLVNSVVPIKINESITPVSIEEEEPIVEDTVYEGVLIPSNLTPEELEKGLLYSLKDYSEAFIEAEKTTGINAVFLSSVAALESGWAESNVSNTYNNLFGWTVSSGYKSFNSKEECILFVAQRLKELYLTESGIYFNGYEVSDINICYNGRKHWEDNVTLIMNDIQYRIEKGE